MNRILTSAAIGALAMYFLDPQGGRRRRARTRDQVEHARRRLRDAYDVTARDARHRVHGLQAMSRRLLHRGGDVPEMSLQGGYPRRGQQWELLQDNWSPAARVMVGTIGLGLLVRGGLLGRLGGAALLARAITNLDFATLVGMGEPEHGIEVHKTLCVHAPVEQVFDFWSHFENFPHFMSKVRDVHLAGNRSHWVVRGPAGVAMEWTSEVVRSEPNALIEWRSTPDSEVKHDGEVRFEPTDDGGTRLNIRMCYLPPAGALGHAIAALFGADPKSEMDADLMRMKNMIETGRAPHDATQPA